MKNTICLFFLISFQFLYSQCFSQHNISGYVFDAQSKESLIGANIYLTNANIGASSNEFGYYNISAKNSKFKLQCSFIGYANFEIELKITKDTVLNIYLQSGIKLSELTVTGKRQYTRNSETGLVSLSSVQMQALPSLSGEVDVLKVLQTMPGISSASEASASLLVRGGNPDGNLMLLDDIPLYYTGHLGGFTSIFDESAIKSLKTYKAGFPARFGERLSSVVDIRTKDGNMKERRWEVQVGTLVSKLAFNGPIVKDKTAFSLSLRRSNIDWFIIPLTYMDAGKTGYISYKFYDLNAKINHRFSDKDRIYFGVYMGNDTFKNVFNELNSEDAECQYKFKTRNSVGWSNMVASLRWNHVFRPNLFANITLAGLKYQYRRYGMQSQENYKEKKMAIQSNVDFKSKVVDYMAKTDFNWDIAHDKTLKFGSKITLHNYNPSSTINTLKVDSTALHDEIFQIQGYPESYHHANKMDNIFATEFSLYGEYLLKWRRFNINSGLRYTMFLPNKQYFISLQPRLSMNYQVFKNSAIKASYARMEQFTHMLSSDTGGGLPSDAWLPVGGSITPAKSDQFSLGYFSEYIPIGLSWNIDAFYKTLDQLIEFKKGENIFTAGNKWQERIENNGEGRIAGFEVFVEKTSDKLNAWMGYTWTKNQRKFETINQGKPFPAKYERRHDFEVATNYKFNKKVDISATWNYASGIFQTLGSARGMGLNNFPSNYKDGSIRGSGRTQIQNSENGYGVHDIYVFNNKNNYQFPNYHRMDLSIRFKKQKQYGVRSFTIGVINAYNQRNPYTVYYKYNLDGKLELRQKTMFPVLPSVSWKYAFGEKL